MNLWNGTLKYLQSEQLIDDMVLKWKKCMIDLVYLSSGSVMFFDRHINCTFYQYTLSYILTLFRGKYTSGRPMIESLRDHGN